MVLSRGAAIAVSVGAALASGVVLFATAAPSSLVNSPAYEVPAQVTSEVGGGVAVPWPRSTTSPRGSPGRQARW